MKKAIASAFTKIYRSVSPEFFEKIIPVIDFIREKNNKPPIPKDEKLAKIRYPKFDKEVIMIHGVSVGEVLSLENLIKKVKAEFQNYSLVITTGTETGQELARKKYGEIADYIAYFPLDLYETVETFLTQINPSVILIAETELWPNFSYCAKEKNIPLYIINGRISDKSYPSYLMIKEFLTPIFDCYSGIFCQSELDKEKFKNLGAKNVEVMKNLKFEIEKKECDIDLNKGESKVLIAGSTHKGEDEIIFRTYEKLKEKFKNLKLILAPRHLTRIDEITYLLKGYNFNYGFRTRNDDLSNCDLLILDTIGELSKTYAVADIAFIGGSFNNTGGHNPLEAIIYSKPTLSGPSVKNFRDIYSILTHEEAAFVVETEDELYKTLEKLFKDEKYYQKIANNCENCFKNQQGALDFVINKLKEIL